MSGIYDIIMKETYDRNLYLSDVYSPFYISSYALHQFNIANQKYKFFYQDKVIPNLRLHLLMVAPPGFMKTHYLTSFAGAEFSIFSNTGTSMVQRQNINEASFVGTIRSGRGTDERKEGIAERYAEGIIAIDEFDAINMAMKSSYNNQFETQLLAALDKGNLYKDMAGGEFGYKTHLTMWSGIQPTRFDMTAGLGRRFCYTVFVPTEEDNTNIRDAIRKSYNMKHNAHTTKSLHDKIKQFNARIKDIRKVEFDDSLHEFYCKENMICHETIIYNKIALGYCLAKHGADETLLIDLCDDTLKQMLIQEREWREVMQQGIEFKMIIALIEKSGGVIDVSDLISECMLYSWNATVVGSILKSLADNGYIIRKRKTIELQL